MDVNLLGGLAPILVIGGLIIGIIVKLGILTPILVIGGLVMGIIVKSERVDHGNWPNSRRLSVFAGIALVGGTAVALYQKDLELFGGGVFGLILTGCLYIIEWTKYHPLDI